LSDNIHRQLQDGEGSDVIWLDSKNNVPNGPLVIPNHSSRVPIPPIVGVAIDIIIAGYLLEAAIYPEVFILTMFIDWIPTMIFWKGAYWNEVRTCKPEERRSISTITAY